jgi:hypothetical protein
MRFSVFDHICDAKLKSSYRSILAAMTCHSPTSAPDCVGETQRTALIASKVSSESGTLIEAANSRRVAAAIFL